MANKCFRPVLAEGAPTTDGASTGTTTAAHAEAGALAEREVPRMFRHYPGNKPLCRA